MARQMSLLSPIRQPLAMTDRVVSPAPSGLMILLSYPVRGGHGSAWESWRGEAAGLEIKPPCPPDRRGGACDHGRWVAPVRWWAVLAYSSSAAPPSAVRQLSPLALLLLVCLPAPSPSCWRSGGCGLAALRPASLCSPGPACWALGSQPEVLGARPTNLSAGCFWSSTTGSGLLLMGLFAVFDAAGRRIIPRFALPAPAW